MFEMNDYYLRDVNYQVLSTDEWERQKHAALRRARAERSTYLSAIVNWIIRRLRRRLLPRGTFAIPQNRIREGGVR